MSFRQSKNLKHYPLPIAGHRLVAIPDSRSSLIFSSPDGLQSQLTFDHEVILTKLNGIAIVVAAFDEVAFHAAFSPLLEKIVMSAVAHANGELETTFDDGTKLEVHPDDYETWHFQQPAPFSKPPYPKKDVSFHGYGGGLIIF